MIRIRPRVSLTAAILAALAGGILIPAPATLARQAVFVAGAPGGPLGGAGRFGPPVTQAQLEGYAELLKLTDEQRDAAHELLDAMQAEFTKAAAEHRDAMGEVQAEFQESRDAQVLMKSMPALVGKFEARKSELETAFLDDLKLTLSEEQVAQWPGVERMRRRDLAGNATMLSGESVDLVKLVKGLEFPASVSGEIAPVMERYEVDYDRALVERQKLLDENRTMFAGGPPPDPQAMMARMSEVREQSVKVRDVNRSYARQIQSLLPPEEAQRFDAAVKKASFPQVYAPGHTLKSIDAALAFDDLSDDQRTALTEIKDAYIRESVALNEKWAQAIEADESNPDGANIALAGGQTMRIMTREVQEGQESEDPLAKASAARRDLDGRTLDRARELLSDSQKTRLPKRQATATGGWTGRAGGEGGPPPDAVILEVSESHDGVNEPQRSVRVSRPSTGESTEVNSGGGGGAGTPPEPPTPPPAPQ